MTSIKQFRHFDDNNKVKKKNNWYYVATLTIHIIPGTLGDTYLSGGEMTMSILAF